MLFKLNYQQHFFKKFKRKKVHFKMVIKKNMVKLHSSFLSCNKEENVNQIFGDIDGMFIKSVNNMSAIYIFYHKKVTKLD